MEKLWSILLLGALSILFAEVFSGASTLWFLDAWGLLVTYPLYLGHALFLLNLAFLWKKTSPRQLYFFGMLFGLYEALITKVLWFGYPSSSGPMVGNVYGIAWGEFLTLVLFYHPMMSFIVPVFVYELLSNDVLPGHERFLQKNRYTLLLITILIIMGASFQSNGAKYDLPRSIESMAGSILIVALLHVLSKGKTLQSLRLGKKQLISVFIYLCVLYGVTTVVIFPERLPTMVLPYVLILLWYLVALLLLWIDTLIPASVNLKHNIFSEKDLAIIAIFVVGAIVICTLFSQIAYTVLLVMFVLLMGAGVVLFLLSFFSLLRQKLLINRA